MIKLIGSCTVFEKRFGWFSLLLNGSIFTSWEDMRHACFVKTNVGPWELGRAFQVHTFKEWKDYSLTECWIFILGNGES